MVELTCEEVGSVAYMPGTQFVNVYETDRAYGGPEEGGWWYDTGTLVLSRQCASDDVDRVIAELQDEFPTTRKRYSVLYSGGDYDIRIEDTPGADYPKETPYYS